MTKCAFTSHPPPACGVDGKTIAVLLTAALALAIQFYLCRIDQDPRRRRIAGSDRPRRRGKLDVRLSFDAMTPTGIDRWTYWGLACFFSYTILPALLIRFVFRERLADYGVKLRALSPTAGSIS